MTDIGAHLTDHVVPLVSVRQFVLSFPYWLRYRLAYDHDRCTAVLQIFIGAVLGFYRQRARTRRERRPLRLGHVRAALRLGGEPEPSRFSDESPLLANC